MVGATDLKKARMQIKWLKRNIRQICSKAWFTSPRLEEAQDNVPNYFIEEHGLTEKAITEAYFLGRQDGRLTMAQAIMKRLGSEEEEMDIVERLRTDFWREGDVDLKEAATEIERLRQQNAELVEVLKEIANADMFDDECKPTGGGYLINKAQAAIAKATGGE
jgi:hypothetical protein